MKCVHIIRYIYCLIIYIYINSCARAWWMSIITCHVSYDVYGWWNMPFYHSWSSHHFSLICIYAIGSPKTPASLIRSPTIDFLYASDYISVPLIKSTVNPPSPTHSANWHRWMTSVGPCDMPMCLARGIIFIRLWRSWSPGHASGCLSWRYPWA